MTNEKGKLYLIPTTLGDNEPLEVLPLSVRKAIEQIDYYIVENEKSARRFIKKITPRKSQEKLEVHLIDKFTQEQDTQHYLDVCNDGIDVGLLSEAGNPAIADPGSNMVKLAHQKNIRVVPLVGPSSILLAMMSSGFNGQNFAFNGYLPIDANDRKHKLKQLEKQSKTENQSQIFIETPYRNDQLFTHLCQVLTPATHLCIAADITLSTEYIRTFSIKDWKSHKPNLHKRPAIFIIHKF
ncbi:MAG: SAM-dependent methyltransferase [Flavobacteriales bacterium]|nr:SAM-dependent methyltransferase [Flavobacteriales bacterium]